MQLNCDSLAAARGVGQASRLSLTLDYGFGVLFREVDKELQEVCEAFEDGDRRDACPTA